MIKKNMVATNQMMSSQSLNNSTPLSTLPNFYMLNMMSYGVKYLFSQLVSAVPAVYLLTHCQPTHCWGAVRGRKGLDRV